MGFRVAMMVAVLSWPTKATWSEGPPVTGCRRPAANHQNAAHLRQSLCERSDQEETR